MNTNTPPVALSIAGSDSGGGAGIAADLKTFAAHGVFGTIAITAVTAQDTNKVHGVVALDPSFVDAQIDAVLGDFEVVVAKTGMLASVAIVEMLANRASGGRLPLLVVDPVMVAASGSALMEGDAATAYRRLLPYAYVVTPNLREAEVLLGRTVNDLASMRDAARLLADYGTPIVVVKGGHLRTDLAVDVVAIDGELVELAVERIASGNTHGTGCTLSSAIAANLANASAPLAAIQLAKNYVTRAIEASSHWHLGGGPGPLNHFASPAN